MRAVPIWCTRGACLTRSRCASGWPAMHVWLAHGARLACSWCVSGLLAASSLSSWSLNHQTSKLSLLSAWLSWVQGLSIRSFPPWLSQVAKGLTNPPPPAEVDALVDLVCQYAWTVVSNCHKVISLSHVASTSEVPFH